MKNFPQFFGVLLCCLLCLSLSAQDIKSAQQTVDAQQKIFRDFLMTSSLDENIKKEVQRFAVNDANTLQKNLQHLATASKERRAEGIRSISFFMKELQKQLQDKKFNQFKAPGIIRTYKQTLTALLEKRRFQPLEKIFKDVGWRSSQLLANSFWEFEEAKQMTDLSSYKRVTKTPEYIFAFLESKPGFYYTDSLIFFMASNYPSDLLSYMFDGDKSIVDRVKNHKSKYVQQVVSISSNSLATELAPFTEQLANNELAQEEILAKRKKVTEYFQLLVNTIISDQQKMEDGVDIKFEKAVRNALREKALDFYVKKINDLHNSPDAVRFQSVQSLRPQDLYYIIVSADEDMYTSTYLGLYKRLLAQFTEQSADSIFTLVHYDKFRKFLRIASTYNTLTDFLHHMPLVKSHELIHLFISDIEDDSEDEAVADATSIADSFISLSNDPDFNAHVKQELEAGLKKSRRNDLYESSRLYSILQQVHTLINDDQPGNLFTANYKAIPLSSLKDKSGNISELILFYGDEDGINSFNSFMSLFKDKASWEVKKNEEWVTISSLQGQPLKIYANLPLKSEDERDIAAQRSLVEYLKNQSINPAIVIHRGHSYHLPHTLEYLQPSTKIAFLGSCGGYKNMKKVMDINSDMHIIASKQVGSMAVNDPFLNKLNKDIVDGKNIDWINFWNELNSLFSKDPNAAKLFEEYVPPYKNLSSFVVKLYNYYDEDNQEGTK
jgi:hypothetical protein